MIVKLKDSFPLSNGIITIFDDWIEFLKSNPALFR